MKNSPIQVAQNLYRDPVSQVYYGRKMLAGRPRWKSLGTTVRAKADSGLKAWLIELAQNAPGADKKLCELVCLFKATRAGLKPKTVQLDSFLCKIFEDTFPATLLHFGGVTSGLATCVQSIKSSHLLTWLNTQEKARGWSHCTYNRYRLFLRQLFDVAEADGVVTEANNPFKPKFIKTKRHVETDRNIPTDPEFYAIIDDVRAHSGSRRDKSADFLAFEGLAALGQAETADLEWTKVGKEFLSIRRRKTSELFQVPIYPWLRPLLDKLESERTDISPNAKVFGQAQAAKALRSACRRLDLPQFTQRNLRQCGIARLAHAGVTPRQASLWQGHTDGGVLIQKIYRKVRCSDDAALEKAEIEKTRKAMASATQAFRVVA